MILPLSGEVADKLKLYSYNTPYTKLCSTKHYENTTIQYHIIQYNTIQYNIIQYNTRRIPNTDKLKRYSHVTVWLTTQYTRVYRIMQYGRNTMQRIQFSSYYNTLKFAAQYIAPHTLITIFSVQNLTSLPSLPFHCNI